MKLTKRIGASWNLLTKGVAFPMQRKAKSKLVMWPTWKEGEATWAMVDLSAYINEGFNLNAIIYSVIMYKVRTATAAPLRAYIGERDHKEPAPPGHPLTQLLDRPNQYQSFPELDSDLTVNFNLFGNAYVWFKRDTTTGYPSSMFSIRPDRVRHLYKNQELQGFAYVPEGMTIQDGTPLALEDTMHVRLPNPGDPFMGMGKGLSPIAPLAQSGDVDNAATAFLKQFFDHGAMPPGLLSFDTQMMPEDVAAARNRWMEIYGGSNNWTDIAVMDQGGTYQRLGLTFDELNMESLDARNEGRMVMPFGVPLTLIESRPALVQATYNNKESDRVMYWEDTRLPELRMFEVEWNYFLHGDDGAFPAYDLSAIPALQKQRAVRAARLLDAAQAGLVTRAEYKEAEGLPFEDTDNIYLVPMMMRPVPVGATPMQPALTTPDDEGDRANSDEDDDQRDKDSRLALQAPAKKKDKGLTAEEKQLVGKAIDDIAAAHEGKAKRAARKAFEKDRRNIRAIVTAGLKSAIAAKATVAWMDMLIPVNEYYRTTSKDNWREEFAPVFESVVMAQGKQLNSTYGMTFDVRNLFGEDWYRSYEMAFADPIADTSMDEIRDLFSVAFRKGASVPEMERSLDALFKQWVGGDLSDAQRERTLFAEERLPPYRLENIARTETMRMSNAGAGALYKDWGVHRKEWLATRDGRVRDSHAAANGQVVGIDSKFEVGGALLKQPGDPSGPPEETINCRCTVLPVLEEAEMIAGAPEERIAPAGFVSADDTVRWGTRAGLDIQRGEYVVHPDGRQEWFDVPTNAQVIKAGNSLRESTSAIKAYGFEPEALQQRLIIVNKPDYGLGGWNYPTSSTLNIGQVKLINELGTENRADYERNIERDNPAPSFQEFDAVDVWTHEIGHKTFHLLTEESKDEWRMAFEDNKNDMDVMPSYYAQEHHTEAIAEFFTADVNGRQMNRDSDIYGLFTRLMQEAGRKP